MKFLGSGIVSFSDAEFPFGPVGHDVKPEEVERHPIAVEAIR